VSSSDPAPAPRRFEPGESEAGAPYWHATRERRLELPWCRACERPHWYPREVCPHCLGPIEWRPASGRGVVYAASVMPKPAMPLLADRVPYVVALVDLDEGVRVMTTLVDVPDTEAALDAGPLIGTAVEATWEPLSDGRHLLLFRPA
jgi:uncharacterized OB-fold protein